MTSDALLATTNALGVLEAISGAFETSDWTTLRSLYDDDARISSVAAGQRVLGPDELMEVLSQLDVGSYYTDGADTVALDDQAVVVCGLARQRGDGETRFTRSAWLLTFRDGLVWRSKAYPSIEEARAAYEEHGPGLGMS
jgi:hypothetical protein